MFSFFAMIKPQILLITRTYGFCPPKARTHQIFYCCVAAVDPPPPYAETIATVTSEVKKKNHSACCIVVKSRQMIHPQTR